MTAVSQSACSHHDFKFEVVHFHSRLVQALFIHACSPSDSSARGCPRSATPWAAPPRPLSRPLEVPAVCEQQRGRRHCMAGACAALPQQPAPQQNTAGSPAHAARALHVMSPRRWWACEIMHCGLGSLPGTRFPWQRKPLLSQKPAAQPFPFTLPVGMGCGTRHHTAGPDPLTEQGACRGGRALPAAATFAPRHVVTPSGGCKHALACSGGSAHAAPACMPDRRNSEVATRSDAPALPQENACRESTG